MTPQDRLNRATIYGDTRIMSRASVVINGIADLLDSEEITDFHRAALHEALRLAAESLDDRVAYLEGGEA
ncbi:MAG: hypothetical protein AWU55_2340 [Halomonadaceae bacterium T82-2]|nr:MAG: hypothetical protein AWU55_2340 [Halomonadaceae bacterium T82-2]